MKIWLAHLGLLTRSCFMLAYKISYTSELFLCGSIC